MAYVRVSSPFSRPMPIYPAMVDPFAAAGQCLGVPRFQTDRRGVAAKRGGLFSPRPRGVGLAGFAGLGGCSGSSLSVQSVYNLARDAGFIPETARQMVAIAQRESSLIPNCLATSVLGSDEASYGLWQINMKGTLGASRRAQFGIVSDTQLLDPGTNARAAFLVSSGGADLSPWHVQSDTALVPYRTRFLSFLGALPDASSLEAGYGGVDLTGSTSATDLPSMSVPPIGGVDLGASVSIAGYDVPMVALLIPAGLVLALALS